MDVRAQPGPAAAAAPPVLIEGLRCRLGHREVLHGIDLRIEAGEVLGILGPNGSGKTTLLRCVAGLQAATAGRVLVFGEDVRGLAPAAMARRLAMQGQDASAALGFRVRDVVGMGRLAHRSGPLAGGAARDEAIVARWLVALDVADLADRPVEAISGGERQRVMIARALAQEPEILVLDEPTNHLDVRHRFRVLDLARGLGITVAATLHDLDLAARYCDRVALLSEGRLVAHGPPAEALDAAAITRVYAVGAVVERRPATGRPRIDLHPLDREPDA